MSHSRPSCPTNPLRFLLLFPLLFSLQADGEPPLAARITFDPATPANPVLLTWEAVPTKVYEVLSTTALGQPWQPVSGNPVLAERNWVRFATQAGATTRFYQVVKRDTDPPDLAWSSPRDGAIAVGRQSAIAACLQDETGIDPSSIALTLGTERPVTLADARLKWANGVLTYTPGANEFLGTHAQTVGARLVVADTLGHRATNGWSFRLERPAILTSEVVLIGNSPGPGTSDLTLVSTNGDTYVFSFPGAASGLSVGQVLVGNAPGSPYLRTVLSFTEDPANRTVSVLTRPASLSECIQQGSFRLATDSPAARAGRGAVGLAGDALPGPIKETITFDGEELYNQGGIRVEVATGRIAFAAGGTVAGDFNPLAGPTNGLAFDTDIRARLEVDLTLRTTFETAGELAPFTKRLAGPFRYPLGVVFVGAVPVWAEAVLEFNIGCEGGSTGGGTAWAGLSATGELELGSVLRQGQWSPYAASDYGFTGLKPGWQITGAARLRGFVEPRLTIVLNDFVGPVTTLDPYLELSGLVCVPPGQPGTDVRVKAGLPGNLGQGMLWWSASWQEQPVWSVFNLQQEVWQETFSPPAGPLPEAAPPNLVWIPCGTFTMGSPDSEPARDSTEGPQTRVTLSQGIWMAKYEVTQGEYSGLMGSNPSKFTGDATRPVEQVSWSEAAAYCAALTARERAAGRLPSGYAYRLPTEAEWEYACRASTTAPFHYGSALRSGMADFIGHFEYPPCGITPGYCFNAAGAYLQRTTSVGSYAPNAWGLHDLHGNVAEWCQDLWASSLPGGSVTDPQGPPTGSARVIRGGSWNDLAYHCRSASRFDHDPAGGANYIGFRVVLAPGKP